MKRTLGGGALWWVAGVAQEREALEEPGGEQFVWSPAALQVFPAAVELNADRPAQNTAPEPATDEPFRLHIAQPIPDSPGHVSFGQLRQLFGSARAVKQPDPVTVGGKTGSVLINGVGNNQIQVFLFQFAAGIGLQVFCAFRGKTDKLTGAFLLA